MNIDRIRVDVTTDASGDFTTEIGPYNGVFWQLRYVPDGSSPLATGADIDITETDTGVVIADHDDIGTSAFTAAYRQFVDQPDGTASTTVMDYIAVGGKITVTVVQGGNTNSGTLFIYIGR